MTFVPMMDPPSLARVLARGGAFPGLSSMSKGMPLGTTSPYMTGGMPKGTGKMGMGGQMASPYGGQSDLVRILAGGGR